jgi:hypothetical protein
MDDLTLKLKGLKNRNWIEYIELQHAVIDGCDFSDYRLSAPYAEASVTEEEYNACKLRVLVTGSIL